MNLDPQEIRAIATELAPAVADLLEERFSRQPAWAFSVSEAAAFADVPEDSIRHGVKVGKIRSLKIGNNLRILRADLFAVREPSK